MKNYFTKYFQSILLYVIFALLMLLTISVKSNLHVDEIYSYGLANSQSQGITMDFQDGKTYIPSSEPWITYMTVSEGHQFDYANVWDKQAADVHPPLYYAILHTICSLFPGSFSIWHAGSINIIFALLTLYVFRKLLLELLGKTPLINAISLAFVLLPGIYSNISFLRMYTMAMFWVLLIAYIFFKAIKVEKTDKRFWIKLCIISILGALTHYYCIIYLFFTCLVFGIYLLWKKQLKAIVLFIIDMVAAGSLSLFIFPSMLTHIFSSYRGQESLANFSDTFTGHINRIKQFSNYMNNALWGG